MPASRQDSKILSDTLRGRRKVSLMILLPLTLVLLLFIEPATEALNRWTGIRSWNDAGRAATVRALTVVVLVALVFALDPELRVFLVLVDALGVDIFLMLLFFQGREILHWLIAARLPLVSILETWGWYPVPLPPPTLFKHHPWWSAYAAVQPVFMILIVSVPLAALVRWASL
jgi:hypothetical protein